MKKQAAFLVVVMLIVLCACTAVENQGVEQGINNNQVDSAENQQPPPGPEPIEEEPTPTPIPAVEEDPTPTPEAAPAQAPLKPVFLEEGSGLSSTGPWMVFNTFVGLVVVAADGSEVVSLGFPLDDHIISWDVASHGGVLALVKDYFSSFMDDGHKWLEIRRLPSNELILKLELMDYAGEPLSFDTEQDRIDFIADLNRAVGELAWSHDGNTLAFVGAQEGPSPDVYSYSLETGEVLQLTSGPAHAVELSWSPDDAYIFHAGVEKMYVGYSGAGYSGWTFYAAKPDGSGVLTVADGPDGIQLEEVLGWYSNNQVLMASGQWYCGFFDFRMVNIENGATTMIMKGQHTYSVYSPASQKALVWISPDSFDSDECGPAGEPGLYLVSVPGGQMEKLEGVPDGFILYEPQWDETSGLFLIEGRKSWLVVDPEGAITEVPYPPAYSPDGKWIAYVEGEGDKFRIYNTETGEENWRMVSGRILHPIWSLDSSRLFYFAQSAADDRVYDLYMMDIPGFTSTLIVEGVIEKYNPKPVWLMP